MYVFGIDDGAEGRAEGPCEDVQPDEGVRPPGQLYRGNTCSMFCLAIGLWTKLMQYMQLDFLQAVCKFG